MGSKKKTSGAGWELVRGRTADELLPRKVSAAPAEQRIRVSFEKRAKGKGVTVAAGFLLVDGDLQKLGKKLKATCGSGGSIKPCRSDVEGGAVEIQGDHVTKLRALLADLGYQLK